MSKRTKQYWIRLGILKIIDTMKARGDSPLVTATGREYIPIRIPCKGEEFVIPKKRWILYRADFKTGAFF